MKQAEMHSRIEYMMLREELEQLLADLDAASHEFDDSETARLRQESDAAFHRLTETVEQLKQLTRAQSV